MIKPNHECGWSSKRTTQVGFADRSFFSAGTSLPVLFDAFREEDLRWYTHAYGYYIHRGEPENLWLIAVDPQTVGIPQVEPYTDLGPLQKAIGNISPGTEYPMTDLVQAFLHLSGEEGSFSPLPGSKIRYTIHTHDDCFGEVTPVDIPLLTRLIHSTLKLHSYYLNEKIDWQDILTGLTDLLPNHEGVDLVSNLDERTLVVRHKDQRKSDPSYLAKFIIAQGKAILNPGVSAKE